MPDNPDRYPYGIRDAMCELEQIVARLDDAEAGRVELAEGEAHDLGTRSARIEAQMTAAANDLRAIQRDRLN